jgi:large subunit ribosomal protein L17
MFRNQLTSLFTHDRIITTLAKAKDLRPVAERMVTLARSGSLPARRKVLTMVPDKDVVRRLFDEVAPRFAERPGGYTRILKLGRRRGDNAPMAIIEFVDYELAEREEGGGGEKKASLMDRAKGMFGGGRSAADEGEPEAAAESVDETAEEAEAEVDEPAAEAAPDAEPEEAAPDAEAEEPEKKDE